MQTCTCFMSFGTHVTLPLSGLLRGEIISRLEVARLGTKRDTRPTQLLTQLWGLDSADLSVSKWFSSTCAQVYD